MSNLDPGLPQDPDHELYRQVDEFVARAAAERRATPTTGPSDCPGGTGPIIRITTGRPGDPEHLDVPVLDWCYAWPLSQGRAAPGSRRNRGGGRPILVGGGSVGPGALWCTTASTHLLPEWAPRAATQSGVSLRGIHLTGGITAASVVVVPRHRLLEVAEYADALLVTSGAEGPRPEAGLAEWSLALAGGPTGTWFGVRLMHVDPLPERRAAVVRFAEAVDAAWIVDVRHHHAADADGPAGDRLTVSTGWGSEVYRWDHGEIRLVDPLQLEPRLDPADVRTVHDAAAYVAARRDTRAPWFDLAGD